MTLSADVAGVQEPLTRAASNAHTLMTGKAGNPRSPAAKAKAASEDFEAMFLNSMFQQMFTAIGSEGPLGSSTGTGVWRSFLTDQYAKSFAHAGGVGIAKEVYGTLLAQQEAKAR
jgi:Rod binding domain-containing protein